MYRSDTWNVVARGVRIDLRGSLGDLVAGLVGGLTILFGAITPAAAIFTGALEPYLSVGIGLSVFTVTVGGVVLALLSRYPAALGGAQLAPAVGLGIIGSSMAAGIGPQAPGPVVFGTMLLLIGLATLSLGLVLFVFGWRRWGNLVRFVPYPVIGGFLAFAAIIMVRSGIENMLGEQLTLEAGTRLLQPGTLLLWLPGLALALALAALQRWRRRGLNVPVVMIGAVVLFWLVAWIADLPAADLRQAGYLLPRLDHQGEAMWSPPFLLGALADADWQAAMLESPKLVVLWLVTLITFLLSASTIEVATQSDVDLNRELKVAGAANLLCSLGGGLPGYQSASSTTMAYLMGGRGRTVGLVAALLCGLALAFAAPLISYLPKLLLGLMLLYAAIELATMLIRDQWARMPGADRVVLVVVLASFLALGFLEGLVIGIVAGLAVFAFSYARVDLVREAGNAARYRSTVFRPAAQLQVLDQDPDAIQVVALQGYLFFGSVHNLLQRLGVLLGAPVGEGRGAGCLILDFARVDGADASALFAFTRLLQRARKQGRPVLFAAVPQSLARALPGAGGAVAAHSFDDLDHALEHAENAVLGLERTSAPQSGLDDLEAAYPAVGVRRQLMTYCERVSWRAGEAALRQGDPSDAMFFVESGQLTVWRDRADGQRIRLSTIVPGTVIGEVGFYLGTVRSATVIADQPSSAFCITRPALQRMQDQDQALAVTFHRFIATVAAERLSGSIELLARAGP